MSGASREQAKRAEKRVRLSSAQADILSFLQRRHRRVERDGPSASPEISRRLGHRFDDWAYGKLVALERKGLVERLGVTFSGGRCWGLTPAGAELSIPEDLP